LTCEEGGGVGMGSEGAAGEEEAEERP